MVSFCSFSGYTLPCGAPERGSCNRIQTIRENFSPYYPQLSQDDRLNWPTKFFNFSCQCHGNYGGYMCQDCAFGYTGENCQIKKENIRRNVLNLTKEEKLNFRDILLKSRLVKSDYVVQANVFDVDPTTKYTFYETTVYDYFIWHHYYSTRSTILHYREGEVNMRYDHEF